MIDVERVGVVSADVTLLQPVSVHLPAGYALVVRGRNGAGKSTLLRVLAGARKPSHGTARIGGSIVDSRDRRFRRRVAAMIGLPPTAPDLTVLEHVRLVAATWTPHGQEPSVSERELLGELGLDALVDRFPHELSSGQTQLFGLALVLARPFDVLLLDEPEQRLDPEHLAMVARILRARRNAGAAVVVATHSAVLADAVGDRTLQLDRAA